MDENGDAEGNYTLVSRQRKPDAAKGYGLFPAGRFARLRNLTKNPVNFVFSFFLQLPLGPTKPPEIVFYLFLFYKIE